MGNIVFSGTAPNCTATLSPTVLVNGTTTVQFTLTDGVLTAVESFDLTVAPVNDPPVLSAIGNQTTTEDTPVVVPFTITDPDNVLICSSANLSLTSSNATLLPVANAVYGGAVPNCTVTLTPVADQSGVSNITLTVNDNGVPNLQDTRSLTFTVTAVNDAPVLSAISNQTSTEDSAITVNFTITDVDNTLNCGTSLTATSSDGVLLPVGNIVFSGTAPNCTAVLTPALNQNGVSNIGLTLTDGALTSVQNFTATYTAVNDAPVLSAISNQTSTEDNAITVNFTITDVDNTLNCGTSLSATSSDGVLLPVGNIVFSGVAPNCTAVLTPALDQSGVSNVGFTLTDGALTSVQNFTATYTATNDAPVLSAISNQTVNEDNSVVVNFTITDVDNTLNCGTSMTASSSDTVVLPVGNIVFAGTAPNCTATLSPALDQNGNVNLTFRASDGALFQDQTFTLTVTPVNDAPVLSAIANQAILEGQTASINFTITDVDNTLNCGTSMSATSSNITLLPVGNIVFSGTAPNCTAVLTPAALQNGITNVSFTLTDGILTSIQSFSLSVSPQNDPPVLGALSAQTVAEDNTVSFNFTINDPDSSLVCDSSYVNVSSNNVALIDVAQITVSGTAPNCQLDLAPLLNRNGSAVITVTVSDLEMIPLTDTGSFTFTVTAVNDAPVLSAISNQTSTEDNAITVNFTITDVDNTLNCGTSMTASSSDSALLPVGNIVFSGTAPNCTAVLTPALNQNGVSNIGFTLTDGALTSVQNFTATYTAVNDAPVLSAISNQTSTEDNAITVNFTITDVDNTLNCGTSLTATSSDGVLLPVGNIVFSGTAPNCTAVLTPALDQSGVSNIGFTLTDGALTSVQNFTATYTATNDAPVLSAISNQTVNEDNSVVVNFTITDVDNTLNCGTSMTASSSDTVVLPVGNIVFAGTAPNCTATLSPALDQNGNVNLTFRVSDGALFQDQTFTLTVTPVNDAPVLSAIAAQTTTEDNALVIPFTIADVDSLVLCTSANISVVSSSVTLVPNANIVIGGATPNCTLTVTPLADQNGVTNITVTLNDNETPNLQDAETFVFTVTPVNDAPALSAISNQTVNEDNSVVVNFTITDVDDTLNCGTSMTASSSDTVVLPVGNIVFAGTAPNCTATLSPALDQNGNVNLTFRVSDGSLFQDQTFSLTVAPINDAPVLSTISNQLSNEDNAVVVNFTLSDVDNVLLCSSANLSVTSSNTTLLPLANAVIGGTLPNCTLTMTPVLNESGVTTLVLTANDNGIPNLQDTKTFTYTVAAVNDAPVLSAISNQTVNEDNSVVVNFTITDVDDTLNCGTSMTASSSDTVVLPVGNIVFAGTAPNCTATLSPDLNQNGNVNLTFRVSDGTLFQDQTFTLTVTGINDAPVLSAITAQTTSEDNSLAVNFTITDVDNTLNCGTSMTASSSDTVVLPVGNIIFTGTAPNCTATLSPDLNQNGNVNLTFRVSDGTLFQDQTFALTVTPVNDAPTISAISDVTTTEDIATVVNFTINDVDNTLNCGTSLSATSSNVTLQPVANIVFTGTAPNCTATLTPAANQSGSSNISIIVTDGSLSTPEAFVLNVIATDDPPVMSAITNQTVSEDGTINVNFTVTDPDSTLACGSPDVFASSSNATLIPAATITFSGTIPNCTATLTPQPNRFGTSTITIVASDGTNLATRSFTLTVTSVNDAPVMSSLTNQTIKTDESAIANYTLTDVDHTMNCSTSVTVTSSNTAVLPTANIVKSGTAPNCILTITPSLNVAGTSTITVVGSDGTLTATQTMTLTLINVTGLAVSPTTLTLINAGSTSQIQAQATYSDASTLMVTTGVDMSWTSSSTAVATVNNAGSKGLVTAVANGNSNITATYKGLTAVTATSVVTMTGITVSQSVINSGIGSVVSVTSQAIYTPSGTQDITSLTTWTSSNSGVASVSQGVVTLNSAGTATITASYGGYSQTVSVNVQNKSLVSIAVTPASHSMGVNATRDFIATATYSDASTANVTTSATWSSTNTAVATISNTAPTIGRATGLAGGTTTITATIGAVSGNSSLTVTAATLSSIAITPDDALVTSNGSYQLRAIGTFSDASTSDITEQVTWSSSNTTAATISNTAGTRGLATTPTFTGYRTTTITATLGAVSDTTPLGVNGSTVTSILVTPTIQITAGSTYNLKAYANLADGGSIEVTDFAVWSSGSTSVATVSMDCWF